MKIIKPGSYEAAVKSKRFCCERCGCEFEANLSEYKTCSQFAGIHDGIVAECQCPLCSATAYAYK